MMRFLGNLKPIKSYVAVPLPIGPGSDRMNIFDSRSQVKADSWSAIGAIGVILLANSGADTEMSFDDHMILVEFGHQISTLLIAWALHRPEPPAVEELIVEKNEPVETRDDDDMPKPAVEMLQNYQRLESMISQLEEPDECRPGIQNDR